jgi:hypothetical protein
MKNWEDLTAHERSIPYHNPDDGAYRLKTLGNLIRGVIE